jgi:folate-binding protein YgfZ
MATLPLDALHRGEGALFTSAMGFDLPSSFGDPLEEQRWVHRAAGLFDRSYRGVLDLAGKEVGKLLNSIFSSKVSQLSPGEGQLSTLLSAKGKLVAAFQLFHLADGSFRLVFREPLRDAVVTAINKYAFFNDILLTGRTKDLAVLSLEGPKASEALSRALPVLASEDLPAKPLSFRSIPPEGKGSPEGKGLFLVRGGESPEGGFDLWVEIASLEGVWKKLLLAARSCGGGPAGWEAAEALRVEAGVPHHGRDYDEESLPNEVGLEPALTYDKCYVGQEVVARIKTYGHVNQRLQGLLLPSALLPKPGALLTVGGEEAGRLTSRAMSARLGRGVALALVKRKFWEARAGRLEADGGSVEAEVVELPPVRLSPAG